jgi:hypothetical protein
VPNDAEFESAFAAARVSQSFLARYYFRAIENSLDRTNKHPARVMKDNVLGTLEHILPQKPAPGTWSHISEDTQSAYLSRIGNYALLKEHSNTGADNKDFVTVKVPIYKAETVFELTKELGTTIGQWTPELIEGRQERLSKLALKTWPIMVK